MKISPNTTREFVAALIVLASMSLFVDFRVEGQFAKYSRERGRWAELEKAFIEKHGMTPVNAIEELREENKAIKGLLSRPVPLPVIPVLPAGKELLDTP